MKNYYILVFVVAFMCSSFKNETACEYAGSNVNFAKTQTEKALTLRDINQARYHAYKALNAIEKNKALMDECGCTDAEASIAAGRNNLKLAIKAPSLEGAQFLLNKALENISDGLEALQEHALHKGRYATNVLAMNTIDSKKEPNLVGTPEKKKFQIRIDASLEKYRASLDEIVNTVECKEARSFAEKVYQHCEQQLLRPNLSEEKKYYNLRTKVITEQALQKLDSCQ